jgi:hypothetical protein
VVTDRERGGRAGANTLTDRAFFSISTAPAKLDAGNPAHKDAVAQWVRLYGHVQRMLAAWPQLGPSPSRGLEDRRWWLWCLAAVAGSDVRNVSQLREAFPVAVKWVMDGRVPKAGETIAGAFVTMSGQIGEAATRVIKRAPAPSGPGWSRNASSLAKATNRIF